MAGLLPFPVCFYFALGLEPDAAGMHAIWFSLFVVLCIMLCISPLYNRYRPSDIIHSPSHATENASWRAHEEIGRCGTLTAAYHILNYKILHCCTLTPAELTRSASARL